MELLRAEDAAKLTDGEEGDEGAEDDDGAGGELFVVEVVEDASRGLVVDEAFDGLLDEVEEEDEDGEDEGFEEAGLGDGEEFEAAAEVKHLADEDDLGDDQGVDESEGVGEGFGVVVLLRDEVGVGDDGAEEDGEIGGDGGEVFELVRGSLPEARCGGILGHGAPSFLRWNREPGRMGKGYA